MYNFKNTQYSISLVNASNITTFLKIFGWNDKDVKSAKAKIDKPLARGYTTVIHKSSLMIVDDVYSMKGVVNERPKEICISGRTCRIA